MKMLNENFRRDPRMLLLGANAPQYSDPEFLKLKLSKRSRLLLSSGGDRPVLDEGGDGHSVFASAFLDELANNSNLLASPELKTIKAAGHEVGDFFFVPSSS